MKKFVKVLEAPDFTFWHFEIIYDRNNKRRWENGKG
jgi:hypothetical protein